MLLDLEVPVVIGLQGWAAGIGLSLALTADVLVMGASARVRPAYTAIGLTPDGGMRRPAPGGGSGGRGAMDLFLTNRPMGADEALAAGLAARVLPDAELARRYRRARRVDRGRGPRAPSPATKRLVRAANGVLTPEHLDAESASIGERGASVEGREGVAAFVEKRAPAWAVTWHACETDAGAPTPGHGHHVHRAGDLLGGRAQRARSAPPTASSTRT